MEADMGDGDPLGSGNRHQRAELVEHLPAQLVRPERYFAPAEAQPVRQAGMGADADAVLFCQPHHAPHRIRVAAVETAGDIGRGDDLHHRFVVAQPIGTKSFAHVGIQIDLHQFLLSPPLSHRLQGTLDNPGCQPDILDIAGDGLFDRARFRMLRPDEFQAGADAGLPEPPEVAFDHAGDLRIAAGRVRVAHLYDRFAAGWNLDDAGHDAMGAHLDGGGRRDRLTRQAVARAVAARGNPPGLAPEVFAVSGEKTMLAGRQGADRQHAIDGRREDLTQCHGRLHDREARRRQHGNLQVLADRDAIAFRQRPAGIAAEAAAQRRAARPHDNWNIQPAAERNIGARQQRGLLQFENLSGLCHIGAPGNEFRSI
ncbi:hypothetical protein RHECNPAF_1360083 [Rhizobium etli CNPAF512]|nr:hypothetical protein RHECNPAF_1360083 [Rhizobium etli CNPAF512]